MLKSIDLSDDSSQLLWGDEQRQCKREEAIMSERQSSVPSAPKSHHDFVERYPKLADAWQRIAEAGAEGPLDGKTQRLVKLAVAVGAMREGAVHAGVRKALGEGIEQAEIEQVVALAAGTIGLPASAAAYTWMCDITAKT